MATNNISSAALLKVAESLEKLASSLNEEKAAQASKTTQVKKASRVIDNPDYGSLGKPTYSDTDPLTKWLLS